MVRQGALELAPSFFLHTAENTFTGKEFIKIFEELVLRSQTMRDLLHQHGVVFLRHHVWVRAAGVHVVRLRRQKHPRFEPKLGGDGEE